VPAGYPTTIVESTEHRAATAVEWTRLFESYGVPPDRRKPPDLAPFTHTPQSLLGSGPIPLANKGASVDDDSIRLLVREFIARHAELLGVAAGTLSLESVDDVGGIGHRYTFVQSGFPYPIAPPAGRLLMIVSPTGQIVQLSDTALPSAEVPDTPRVTRAAAEKVVLGTTFTYGDKAGHPQSVTIGDATAVHATSLVVYAAETDAALSVHLAWQVDAGTGLTWTVFVDAVTGQIVGKRQNFQM